MNTSELMDVGGVPVELITLETPGLGNRSYLVIVDGRAIAVDVQRDLDHIQQLLASRDARLATVVETHVHNDYVTGGLALARHFGADYVIPAGPTAAFSARRGEDGERVAAGPMSLRMISTPGHTDAHTTYALHVGDSPALAAFTGGSLLLGGTGRTDLLGREKAAELAVQQYWSARRLARHLPPEARLLPTHGFGSHCLAGQAVKSATDRLADQLEINPAFLLDEDAFVQDMLSRCGPIPAYFPKMAPRNLAGPDAADLTPPSPLSLRGVAEAVERGEFVIDTRPRAAFAAGHVPGTINIDARGALATWTGWVADIDEPINIVTQDFDQLAHVQRELSRIGVDRLAGAHVGPFHDPAVALATQEVISFPKAARMLRSRQPVNFVDVRDKHEWAAGHIRGAHNVPAHEICDADVPDNPHFYCGVGFRAAIAASLLARVNRSSVVIDDAISRARRAGIPWCTSAQCTDGRCNGSLVVAAAFR